MINYQEGIDLEKLSNNTFRKNQKILIAKKIGVLGFLTTTVFSHKFFKVNNVYMAAGVGLVGSMVLSNYVGMKINRKIEDDIKSN